MPQTHSQHMFNAVECSRIPDKSLKHEWVKKNDVMWLSSRSSRVDILSGISIFYNQIIL